MTQLERMTEEQIMKLEDSIFVRLRSQVPHEVAAWLSIVHSIVLRLNNRVHDIEAQRKGGAE